MNTPKNIDTGIFATEEFKVLGPAEDPGAMLTQVIFEIIKGSRDKLGDGLKGLIFLCGYKQGPIKEVVEIMVKNPRQRVIVIDPLGLNARAMDSEAQIQFGRLSKFNFVKSIGEHTTLLEDIKEAIAGFDEEEAKLTTLAGIDSFKVTSLQQNYSEKILGYLKHDLPKTIDGDSRNYTIIDGRKERFDEIISKAREAFDMKNTVTENQIVGFILDTQMKIEKVMEGEIKGVYCDIDDTILDKDGKVIDSTLAIIQKLEAEGYPIFIWTGGDLKIARDKLSQTPYAKYDILSKYNYAGAEAEIVIDNVSPEKFAIQTGIRAKRFIRV